MQQAQSIAGQILSQTPSSAQAPVNTAAESTESKPGQNAQNQAQTPNLEGDDFHARIGILNKMERKVRERENKIKEEYGSWPEERKRMAEMEAELKLFDENPLEFMKKKKNWGVQEFNEFAVQHSSDDDLDPVAKMTKDFQRQLDEMKSKLTEEFEGKIKSKEEEYTTRDHERQIVEFKSGIKNHLSHNKDQYEFILSEGKDAEDAVYDLIYQDIIRQQEEAKEAGNENPEFKLMDIKDAADKVENFLDSQYSKYLSLNKVKSRFSAGNEGRQISLPRNQGPETLNSSFSPKSKSVSELSEEERKQQAANLVRSWRQNS